MEEIKEHLPHADSESIGLRGLFVLMVSAMEIMLTDTYIYYLRSYPEAFDFKDVKFSKDDILEANLALDLIARQVDKNAVYRAYDSFPELLQNFTERLGITKPLLDATLINRIVEVKETRNILLHNDLRANRRYIERTGDYCRQAREGNTVPLTQVYVNEARQALSELIQELQKRMSTKFGSFTRLAALRRLWEYLFSSPIMPFDDFWATDAAEDKVIALKMSPLEKQLSSSERAFLGVWRAHFNGWNETSGTTASMYTLDSDHKRKMLWFLAILADFNVG